MQTNNSSITSSKQESAGGKNLLTSEKKRSYFIMLPLIVDDMGLSVYAFRLYVHIARRVGSGGECWENTRNMAKACNMSIGAVSKAKKELAGVGLISVAKVEKGHGEFAYDVITLIDNIWEKNMQAYSTCSPGEPKYIPNLRDKKRRSKKGAAERASQASPGKAPGEDTYPAATTDLSSADSLHAGETPERSFEEHSMINHEGIQAIKRITGYYPPNKLYREFIKAWEEVSFENKALELEVCFKTYVARYRNPTNYAAWFFDWFREGMAYVPDDIRRLADQFRQNIILSEEA